MSKMQFSDFLIIYFGSHYYVLRCLGMHCFFWIQEEGADVGTFLCIVGQKRVVLRDGCSDRWVAAHLGFLQFELHLPQNLFACVYVQMHIHNICTFVCAYVNYIFVCTFVYVYVYMYLCKCMWLLCACMCESQPQMLFLRPHLSYLLRQCLPLTKNLANRLTLAIKSQESTHLQLPQSE